MYKLNEAVIKSELEKLVRGSVEERLNELLEDSLRQFGMSATNSAELPQRPLQPRQPHYDFWDVILEVPKLKEISFETAIIE